MKDTLTGLMACAVLAVLGGLMLAKPELMWKIEHFLDVKDGWPSDWYKAWSRIGGAIFLIIGILGFLFFGGAVILYFFA